MSGAASLRNGHGHAGDYAHLLSTAGATGDQPPDIPAGLEAPPDLTLPPSCLSIETWRSRARASQQRALFLRVRARRRARLRAVSRWLIWALLVAAVIVWWLSG